MVAIHLLVKPFWILGIDRAVQNAVGPAEFGLYFAAFNFSLLFNVLLDAGITHFNHWHISQNAHLLARQMSSIVAIKIGLVVLYLAATLTAGAVWGYGSHQMLMLVVLAINQCLASFVAYLRSNVSALLLFGTDSLLSVLDRLFMIAISAALLWGGFTPTPFRIEWFLYAQSLGYLLTALTAWVVVRRHAALSRLAWDVPFAIALLKRSLPFALLGLLITIYTRVDAVLLERLLPGELGGRQAGIYAMGYRLLDAANMLAYPSALLLLPVFARLLKRGEAVQRMLALSFTLVFVLAITATAASCFYASEIMGLLYVDDVGPATAVFRVLMAGLVATTATYVCGTLLTASGSLRALNIVAAAGVVVSLALNGSLIPRYMAMGAAVASLATQYAVALAHIVLVRRKFGVRANPAYLAKLAGFTAGVIGAGYVSRLLPWDWRASLAAMAFVSILLGVALRLVDLRAWIGPAGPELSDR